MCFVRSWNSGFCTSLAALWLSQYILVALSSATISNLFRNRRKYTASLVASVSAMYSASVLEIATLFCFLDSHDMAPFDNLNMKPVLDFLSSISPLQSESTYPVRLSPVSLKHRPMLDVPLR